MRVPQRMNPTRQGTAANRVSPGASGLLGASQPVTRPGTRPLRRALSWKAERVTLGASAEADPGGRCLAAHSIWDSWRVTLGNKGRRGISGGHRR